MIVIELKDYGQAFSTRERANQLVTGAVHVLAPVAPFNITVNLSGVVAVSYSFADELINQLERAVLEIGGGEARLTNANDAVGIVFRTVLSRRSDLAEKPENRTDMTDGPKVLIGTG